MNQAHQGKALQEYLRAKNFDLKELAPKLGIKRQYFYNKYFMQETLDKDFLSKVTLVTGFDIKNVTRGTESTGRGNIIYIPLYAYGGFLQGYADKVYMDTLETFSLPGIHGQHYGIEVMGESMVPFAKPGELAIVRYEEKLEWMIRGKAYVLQTIDGILIKFFKSFNKDTFESSDKAVFSSANKEFADITIPLKSIKRVYRVIKTLTDPYA